jgi:2-oxoisovalerate dehydrogenase E2 component (dihydrolipoyl transacylase)
VPDIQRFRLPDAGEGLTEAEIVTWRVKPGDTVRINDPIVEIETAKSLVELPSPFAGVVTELLVPEGVTVDVGTPIIAVDTAPGTGPAPDAGGGVPAAPEQPVAPVADDDPTRVQQAPEEGAVEPGMIGGPANGGRTAVLVGYGPRTTSATRRPRRTPPHPASTPSPSPAPIKEVLGITEDPGITEAEAPAQPAPVEAPEPVDAPAARAHALAKPPVRKLARDLGVDIAAVAASGAGGIVTREDVEQAARSGRKGRSGVPDQARALEPVQSPAPGQRETRIPIKGVRKMTAEAMVASAFTAPHVTEWVTVDVTRTMKLVERLRADREFAGVKVSPLLVVAKALILAVKRNPQVNATWDEAAGEIVVKGYVNLGIAAATPRGLVVPNVKDADGMSLRQLADALAELTGTAREGRTQPADMSGGTITITNVGVFGVDSGTPILNRGEAAILAFGQVRRQPWVHKGKVKPRWVTQLALSFDHRLVDGDLGSRTLADVAAVLEDPSRALVWS